jgi:hypothetical protein
MEQSPYYQFYFNKVFVIESLPVYESRIGKNLHDDTIRPRTWQHSVLKSEYIYVSDADELFQVLTKIEAQVAESLMLPYIHFEMHGSMQGLHLQQNVVTWHEVTAYLRNINIATRNNLMLSFATCYGNEIHKLVDFNDRAPFFGFIAPTSLVSITTVKNGFDIFFTKLFTGQGFRDAYDALNDECVGDEHFALDNCEDAFTKPLKKQILELQDPNYYFMYVIERANEMLAYEGIRNRYSLIELIEQAKEIVSRVLVSCIQDFDFFLMRDLVPHTMTSQKLN